MKFFLKELYWLIMYMLLFAIPTLFVVYIAEIVKLVISK